MKKNLLIVSLLTVALIIGFVLNSFISASGQIKSTNASEGYVFVRTFELSGFMASSMITVYEDGKVERTELAKINTKALETNLVAIHSKITEIKNLGYDLIQVTGGNSDGAICTTFIFKKKIN